MNEQAIKLFETKKVRTVWNEDEEEWYFSVVDVVAALTDSPDPKRYWSVLKTRLKQEGVESTTICSTFKLLASDGKMRLTDKGGFFVRQQLPLFRRGLGGGASGLPRRSYLTARNDGTALIYNLVNLENLVKILVQTKIKEKNN